MTETGFRVGKDGVNDQTYFPPTPLSSSNYVDVTWPTIIETDTTGGFNTSTGKWTAPANGLFITGWQVWNSQGVTAPGPGGVTAKCVKNSGGLLDAAAIAGVGFYPNSANSGGTMRYRVVQGDVFKIANYCYGMSTSVQIHIDARSEHTYWWGSFVPD